jgi:hypothetical protein
MVTMTLSVMAVDGHIDTVDSSLVQWPMVMMTLLAGGCGFVAADGLLDTVGSCNSSCCLSMVTMTIVLPKVRLGTSATHQNGEVRGARLRLLILFSVKRYLVSSFPNRGVPREMTHLSSQEGLHLATFCMHRVDPENYCKWHGQQEKELTRK